MPVFAYQRQPGRARRTIFSQWAAAWSRFSGMALCERRTLADTLAHLLDDGTGRVAPEFLPLVKILLEMDRPNCRLIWLRNPNIVRLLHGLATGSIPLTHNGLHQETPWQSVSL
ncbi:hypothetical protein OG758_10050 [Streptomyces sp. NBC_01474]|uniref:hypothetical protein n=1 Tax=unclassified Streptomyces TaxID=2593676 RepID=UPI002DD8309D|nr:MULTISPECIES: hypothetical protein [unclassified Streptomyces]WSD94473.1 hypothetical protein OG758_10050 [Streptomyces sp. NBC_01474]